MTAHNELLKMFKENTGRTVIRPFKEVTTLTQLKGYQHPRVDNYKWQRMVE